MPPADYFFTISTVTFVVAPGFTSTSFVALPSVSCHTSIVCLPAGTLLILATPLVSVTPKYGCGITAIQPSIQLWTSHVTLTNSGFSNFFRYKLLLERGGWWVDADMVCLRPFAFDKEHVFASEVSKGVTCVSSGAIRAPCRWSPSPMG